MYFICSDKVYISHHSSQLYLLLIYKSQGGGGLIYKSQKWEGGIKCCLRANCPTLVGKVVKKQLQCKSN